MSVSRIISFVCCVMFVCLMAGCGGGKINLNSTPSQPSISNRSGTVSWPGAPPTSASVMTGLGASPISSNGSFTARMFTGGVQLALVRNEAGKPVLLGFLRPDSGNISSRTTAEVLAFFGMGAFTMDKAVRARILSLLREDQRLDAVSAAIDAAFSSGATNPLADGRVREALDAYIRAIAPPNTAQVSTVPQDRTRGIWQLEPDDVRSGIRATIATDAPNTIIFRNAFRRRAKAIIWQQQYTKLSDNTVHNIDPPQGKLIGVKDLAMPGGFTGGLAGSITDVLVNAFNGTPQAYSEQASDPIELSLAPNPDTAKNTFYKITVVGPGAIGSAAGLNDVESNALRLATEDAWMMDCIFPLISCVIWNVMESPTDAAIQAGAGAFIQDMWGLFLGTFPELDAKEKEGDLRGICATTFSALATSSTLRNMVVKKLVAHLVKDVAARGAYEEMVSHVFFLGDVMLFGVDTLVRNVHWPLSSKYDVWTTYVTHPVVQVNPTQKNVARNNGEAEFTASLAESKPGDPMGDPPTGVTWQYILDGSLGSLSDGMHTGSMFSSTRNKVTFKANNSGEGKVTLTVKAYRVGELSEHTYLGKGTAEITVVKNAYTLSSDGKGAGWRVDDDLNIYLNGQPIYSDHDHMPLGNPSVTFEAKKGDTLRITISDNGGSWGGGPFYLTDLLGNSMLISEGDGGWGPTGNTTSVIMWEKTITIPW